MTKNRTAPAAPPTLATVLKPRAWFKPFKANPKLHSPDQVKQIRASIDEFGWTYAILTDEKGEVIAGHGRLLAADLKPAFAEIPAIIATGWTAAQKRAYRIADNKLTENGQWDSMLLKAELQALDTSGFDLRLTGFTGLELGNMGVASYASEAAPDPEETPPLPKKTHVKRGELWLLGDHRLLIGDSTDKADVERLFKDGGKVGPPNLMVTDPPYGVEYDANWRNETDRKNGKAYGASAIGKVANDGNADWTGAWSLFPGNVAYTWHADRHASTVQRSLESVGFVMRSQIIWAKDRLIISRGDYHWKHEPCWYAVRKGKPGGWAGYRSQTTLWEISHIKSETGHSTQKPVECMRRPILNNSKEGDGVYDPFCGSGTTLIACEMEKRRCFAMEIDPVYGQVIIERWQEFANKVAKREDGATLSQLKKGGKHAVRDPGEPVSGRDSGGDGGKRRVRKKVHARQPKPRRGADRKPPAVDAAGPA